MNDKLRLFTGLFIFIGSTLFAQFDLVGKDTISTDSGLKYIILEEGNGEKVQLDKEVSFEWTGYFEDGSSFGTSVGAEPFFFVTGKGQVIKGAEEGLALMQEGDRYLFLMPPQLAYGERGSGDAIPPNATLIFNYKVLSVSEPKLSLVDTLKSVINADGIDESLRLYQHLKETAQDKYAFREGALNRLGYQLMGEEFLIEAIEIFRLNVEEFPTSWNVYDSLGEALMNAGNSPEAILMFEKSLKLNPDNESGKANLKKMKQ